MRRAVIPLVLVAFAQVACWKMGPIGEDEQVEIEDTEVDSDTECHDIDLELSTAFPKVMILQDISSSMNDGSPPKWSQAQKALVKILDQYRNTNIEFGFDIFPEKDGNCFASTPVVYDTQKNNVDTIVEYVTNLKLKKSTSTPLYQGLKRFVRKDYARRFSGADQPSFLLLVSDGEDSCGTNPSAGIFPATPGDLREITAELLDERGIRTLAIGFGSDVSENQLNAIAQAGGTSFSEYLDVQNKEQLEQAFEAILKSVSSCTFFLVQQINQVSKDHIDFFIDDEWIENKEDCLEGRGWMWLGNNRNSIQLCEQTCALLEDDPTRLTATVDCH